MNTGNTNNQIEAIMQRWRLRVQTRMMILGALLAFPAVVQTIWRAFRYPNELCSAVATLQKVPLLVALKRIITPAIFAIII